MSVYDVVRGVHDKRSAGCRGGSAGESSTYSVLDAGCFYGVTNNMTPAGPHSYPFVIFNGDGPEYPFEIVHDKKAQNEILRGRKVSWNEFTGTDRSKRWIEFLLSDQSPWVKLRMHLMTYEPEYINNAGFIFRAGCGPNLPVKLLYNFCMAMRFCWDQPSEFAVWLKFCDEGYHPAKALFLAMNFKPKTGQFEGDWEIMWPWNFLEDGGVECAYRFTEGLPATLETKEHHNPNVLSLWATGKPDKDWVQEMAALPRSLVYITKNVDNMISQQKERLKCAA